VDTSALWLLFGLGSSVSLVTVARLLNCPACVGVTFMVKVAESFAARLARVHSTSFGSGVLAIGEHAPGGWLPS
jgi:hypothetical protein